jgi:hypothetical protein
MHRKSIERLATEQPLCCAVCRRRATEIAYVTKTRETLYLCGDPGCMAAAHKLKLILLDPLEEHALGLAGEKAGAYLDGIGTTDLATLGETEWKEFLEVVVTTFERELRALILAENPPF